MDKNRLTDPPTDWTYGPERNRIKYGGDMEEFLPDKSRVVSLSDLDSSIKPWMGGDITFTNGMLNSFDEALAHARLISDLAGGIDVTLNYNSTHGKVRDTGEAHANIFLYKATPPSINLQKHWMAKCGILKPDVPLLAFATSQGAAHVRNALMSSPKEIQRRIWVTPIAPAAYIEEAYCASVHHYCAHANRDPITKIDWRTAMRCKETITILDSHPAAPFFDHSFSSPTYESVINSTVNNYVKYCRRLGENI